MQIVYRARSFADAESARNVLAASGIPAHIADQSSWDTVGELPFADVIRVLVDNRSLDQARRVVDAWQKSSGKN